MDKFDITKSLKHVRDSIADEDNAFSMEHTIWFDSTKAPKDSFKGKCGTPACILGWAYSHYLEKNSLEAQFSSSFTHADLFATAFREKFNVCSSEVTAPIVQDDSGNTYNFNWNAEWFTRARAVAMLDKLLETNEVDWFVLENNNAAS